MRPPSAAGDRATFERLFADTHRDVLSYLMSRCRDPQLAADLLSETYLIAWEKLPAIPPGDDARPWLFGVARNLLLKGFRQSRVAAALVERLGAELIATRQAVAPADSRLEAAIARALSRLTDTDREVLLLSAWEGLTPREIAMVLGTSANVIRVRLHRARSRVQRDLAAGPHATGTHRTVTVQRRAAES